MKRIRALGLAAIMALALAVVPASASATGGFVADKYPATLSGTPTQTLQLITAQGGLFCKTTVFNETLSAANQTLSLSPAQGKIEWVCELGNGSPAGQLKTNGCKFEFHPGSTDYLKGTYDIGPPGCGPMTGLSFYGGCKMSIGAQTGIPAEYKNIGEGSQRTLGIGVSGNITYSLENCASSGTYKNELQGAWEVVGYDADKNQIGVSIVKELPVGFFLSGKASEKEAEQPKFEAEEYPTAIAGGQDPKDQFKLFTFNGNVTCKDALFEAEITKAASNLTVGAAYSSCIIGESTSEPTVYMNACHYALGVANSGPPYTGSLAIACAAEGEAIKVIFKNGCVVSILPQTLGSVVEYKNLGEGSGRTVYAKLPLAKKVKVTRTGGLCNLLSKEAYIEMSGTFDLHGFK